MDVDTQNQFKLPLAHNNKSTKQLIKTNQTQRIPQNQKKPRALDNTQNTKLLITTWIH